MSHDSTPTLHSAMLKIPLFSRNRTYECALSECVCGHYYLDIGTIILSSVLLNNSLFITLIMHEKPQVLLNFL